MKNIMLVRALKNIQIKIYRIFWEWKVKISANTVGSSLYVGGFTSVNGNTIIGDFVSLNGLVIKGVGNVKISDFVHTGTDCLMITSNHNYDCGKYLPYDESEIIKEIIIGRAAWIGDRVIILGGIEIGEGAIIQAGAVVSKSIPAYSIAGGNPAKVFKMRDTKHFDQLKEKDAFYRW